MKRLLLPVLGAALLLTGLTMPGPATAAPLVTQARPAEADLDLTDFSHLAVDTVHGDVFISEGAADRVIVADHSGNVLGRISALDNPIGLAVSPDSSTVYVASNGGDTIVAIDTTTFAVTATFDLGVGNCPTGVAFAADLLWFSYVPGCGDAGWMLGAVDVATATIYPGLTQAQSDTASPLLASLPTQPDALVASGVSIWDVAGGVAPTATLRAERVLSDATPAPTPDGTELIVSTADDVVALRTTDLSTVRSYHVGAGSAATAVSTIGLTGTGSGVAKSPQVKLFLSGQTTVYGSYGYDDETVVAPDGLAFGPTFFFAVTQSESTGQFVLRAFLPKGDAGLTLRTDRRVYPYQAAAAVTVHLTRGVENRTVSLFAQEVGGARRLVKRAPVNGQGNLVVKVSVFKRTTFSVDYTGDAHTQPGQAQSQVQVQAKVATRLLGYYKTVGNYRLYHTSQDPKVIAKVSPNKAGKCVFFGAQIWNGHGWTSMKPSRCFKLSKSSQSIVYFVGHHQVGQRFRLQGIWHDDGQNARAVGNWSYFRFTD